MAKVLMSWQIQEFEKHKKSTLWYVVGGVILILLLWYCIATSNFLFAIILLMFAIITVLYDFYESKEIEFALTSAGVKFGEKMYSYEEFKRFWIVYEPTDVKKLYLEFNSVLKPRLAIPLNDIDPNKVRQILQGYVKEDLNETDEPLTDFLGRLFKL
jgi:hypothetical protein